ncbi:MAG: hypothetical protein ACP6IY_18895 [Promethearchaeia archaeon]
MSEVKPLDLERIERTIYKIIAEKDFPYCKVSVKARQEILNILLEELIPEIKQRIKSACEFFLRYKDNPDLLIREYPEKAKIEIDYETAEDIMNEIERIIEKYGKLEAQATIRLKIIEYNEWLFRLAFKDVLEEGERK